MITLETRKVLAEQIGSNVRNIMRERDLRLVDLARMSGLSMATLHLIKESKTCPSVYILRNLANSLGIGMDELVNIPDLNDLDTI